MATVNTGGSGSLRVEVSEGALDAANNRSVVNWALYLDERVSSGSTWNGGGVSASVSVDGVGTVYSGTFGFDWRPSGLQSTLIASGSNWVGHSADGSGYTNVTGSIGNTGTSGAGGPTSVAQGITLTTLKVLPGTPSAVVASWVSDTQISVAWSQSSASNGQPTSNTIRCSVNGATPANVVTISPASSTAVIAAANQKLVYSVDASNAAGTSAWSADAPPVFTTPAAPTNVAAAKDTSLDIVISWTPQVAFTEHVHIVEHGTVVGGVTTWDGAPIATVASGTTSYTHVTPDPSKVHVYRVSAKNTDTHALQSSTVLSNTVQLLAAPNKPTLPALAPFVDKAAAFLMTWTHNPVDSTAQTAYEVGYSTDGGTTWATTGKITSTVSSKTFAANTYAANVALTVRVRTWGQATTGGSDGTGASPWADTQTVTFKTRPVATITSPANSSTWTQAALAVALGFTQAEGATFVQATIVLSQGSTALETLASTTAASTALATRVLNGDSYSVSVTVLDSNGLTSVAVVSAFTVVYTLPVVAGVVATYLSDSGIAQLDLTIPTPGAGEVAAAKITIIRMIDGVPETVLDQYAITSSSFTILDLTPSVHATNTFTARTISSDGATATATVDLVTAEETFAFVNTGDQYDSIIKFWCDPIEADPARSSALVQAAGRARPIGLYGTIGSLVLSVAGEITPDSSTPEDIEALLQMAGKSCYRDPFGRRLFGQISGAKIARTNEVVATVAFTITETS